MTLRETLEAEAGLAREAYNLRPGAVYASIQELVARHGETFEPGPTSVPPEFADDAVAIRPMARRCFRNALELVLRRRDELSYVEGYATLEIAPGLPILHAWAATADGAVVDPTWETPGVEFLGLRFRLEHALRLLSDRECFGLLDNPELGFPLLREPWSGAA